MRWCCGRYPLHITQNVRDFHKVLLEFHLHDSLHEVDISGNSNQILPRKYFGSRCDKPVTIGANCMWDNTTTRESWQSEPIECKKVTTMIAIMTMCFSCWRRRQTRGKRWTPYWFCFFTGYFARSTSHWYLFCRLLLEVSVLLCFSYLLFVMTIFKWIFSVCQSFRTACCSGGMKGIGKCAEVEFRRRQNLHALPVATVDTIKLFLCV